MGELQEHTENLPAEYYCGPWWMPRILRRLLSVKFNEACRMHDIHYSGGEMSRLEADLEFLVHMMDQSEGSLFWELVALSYFTMARLAGRLSWGRVVA